MRITKLIAAVIGVPMVIASFALAVGGTIALAVQDDGWIETGPVRIETDSAALVANDIEIDFGRSVTNGRTSISWGEIPARIEVSDRNDKAVFVGIASQRDVDTYLAGVARDEISSLHHDDYDLIHLRGEYQAAPPLEADIWAATSEDGVLEWDVRAGEWAIVALNEDGSPGIDLGFSAAARIPFLTAIGVIAIVGGLIGMTIGTLLVYYGVRQVREPQPTSTPPAADPIVA